MNIVFINGNGFDMNLKMKTSYKEFYEFYKNVESNDPLIKDLKENISSKIENWSDLELELGNYSAKVNSSDEFIKIFEHIGDNLAEYLHSEEKKFDKELINIERLFKYLKHPEESLTTAQKNEILKFKNLKSEEHWFINVITFNYTRTLENIINDTHGSRIIGEHHKQKIVLQDIEHIHGFLNNRMVMGVNDIRQITNKNFRDNQELLEAFVKSECNQAIEHTIDDKCVGLIQDSELICIFGSSIGETDNIWWETIGEHLLSTNCKLIIFHQGPDISERRAYQKKRIRVDIENKFLSRTKLSKDDIDIISDQIFVGVNTDMFSDLLAN